MEKFTGVKESVEDPTAPATLKKSVGGGATLGTIHDRLDALNENGRLGDFWRHLPYAHFDERANHT